MPLTNHLHQADTVHDHELRRRLSRRPAVIGLISALRRHDGQPRRSASDCETTATGCGTVNATVSYKRHEANDNNDTRNAKAQTEQRNTSE